MMPIPSLLPLRIVENRASPVPSGRLFRLWNDFPDVLGVDRHRIIAAWKVQAHSAIIPNSGYASFDLNRVAGFNSLCHLNEMARSAQEAR